ncbi:MAG: nucleoside triphosphate pyrophosphohydrolase [Deltaproteobacteria bacterium]
MIKEKYTFYDLVEIMKILRSENGCPWDREQTHESLKKYLIEETYEVLEAIDKRDKTLICEELGDLLLQIVFHARIAEENGDFDIDDVITGISKKMYSRHTHVFGEDIAKSADDVLKNWDKIKRNEKNISTYADEMRSIAKNLPSLMRSYKVQHKAAKVGFDWDNVDDAVEKVYEELEEVKAARNNKNKQEIHEEIGDLLFAVVNVSRFLEVHPELALADSTEKFIKRFEYIEKKVTEKGKKMEEMTLKEMDELWNQSKSEKI